MSNRLERMIDSTPWYYQHSEVFRAIQQAPASEFDRLGVTDEDLRNQLRVRTATWGLGIWEASVGLPVAPQDSYDVRRSRVLARIRAGAPFSAAMVKSVIEAFTQRPIKLTLDVPEFLLTAQLDNEFVNYPGMEKQVQDIIHAHFDVYYYARFLYESTAETANEYKGYTYPFRLTYTILSGEVVTENVSRTYLGSIDLEDAYHTSVRDFDLCNTFVTRGTWEQNFSTGYQQEVTAEAAYRSNSWGFLLCGTFYSSGEVVAA